MTKYGNYSEKIISKTSLGSELNAAQSNISNQTSIGQNTKNCNNFLVILIISIFSISNLCTIVAYRIEL